MKKNIVIFIAVFFCFSAVMAGQMAQVYIVHGIPGTDLGLDADLPVDIVVNGGCFLQNFKFGSTVGPVALSPGGYNIQIKLKDAAMPCMGTTVIDTDVVLYANENTSIIAHLTDEGDITVSKFVNDLSDIKRSKARIIMHHTANAPNIDVSWYPTGNFPPITVHLDDFSSGDKFQFEIRANPDYPWFLNFAPAGSACSIFSHYRKLNASSAYLIYAVGSVTYGTFRVIVRKVSGL